MEQRKLIRLGNSSFAIALPKEWVDKAGLKKGDAIFIEQNGNGELSIMPKFKDEEEKIIEINIENKNEEFIKKKIHAAYTKGYNNIVFRGKSDKKIIKNLLDDYLSFEIIDSNENLIAAKDFFNVREAKFENFVRTIDNDLREMFDIVLEQSKKAKVDIASLKEIDEIDKAVNKFYFLCSRIFIKGIDNPTILNMLKMRGNELFNNWWVSFHLEYLGDGLKHILRGMSKINVKNKEVINNILSGLLQNYISCMESFYKNDTEKAFEVIEQTNKLKLEIEKLEENNPDIIKIVYSVRIVERKIYQIAKMMSYMKL